MSHIVEISILESEISKYIITELYLPKTQDLSSEDLQIFNIKYGDKIKLLSFDMEKQLNLHLIKNPYILISNMIKFQMNLEYVECIDDLKSRIVNMTNESLENLVKSMTNNSKIFAKYNIDYNEYLYVTIIKRDSTRHIFEIKFYVREEFYEFLKKLSI